jgi:hypothetical protein
VATVARLSIAPVKGLSLIHPEAIELGENGVAENRRFWLVDDDGRRYGLLRDGKLALVRSEYDPAVERLRLTFPDGSVVEDEVRPKTEIEADFYGRSVRGRLVNGPFGAALSEYVGRPLRLARALQPGGGVDRTNGTVSVISQASLAELARRSGVEAVDQRRFRMLILVEGVQAHGEDAWLGVDLRVGDAVVRLHDRVARCAITTQNPDTGESDFDTLRKIKAYRGAGANGKDVDFGVFGVVRQTGRVRIGDPVEPL